MAMPLALAQLIVGSNPTVPANFGGTMLVFLKRFLYGIVVITPIVALSILAVIFPAILVTAIVIGVIYAAGAMVDEELAGRKMLKDHKSFKRLIPHG